MSEPTEAELDFVDEVAVFFEREGLPLISGRVIGWLLISDPPEQSAAELARTLQVSRSSISTATRMLTPSGLVEGMRKRGHRQEYFRITEHGWSRMLERRYAQAAITEHGLKIMEDASPQRRERLANVHELYAFLEDELPTLFRRWEQSSSAQGRPPIEEPRP